LRDSLFTTVKRAHFVSLMSNAPHIEHDSVFGIHSSGSSESGVGHHAPELWIAHPMVAVWAGLFNR